jgi:hypothetical protein
VRELELDQGEEMRWNQCIDCFHSSPHVQPVWALDHHLLTDKFIDHSVQE